MAIQHKMMPIPDFAVQCVEEIAKKFSRSSRFNAVFYVAKGGAPYRSVANNEKCANMAMIDSMNKDTTRLSDGRLDI